MPDAERTALYRFYDADGRLLYIGISRQPDTRWKQHLNNLRKEWTSQATRRTLTWLNSRAEAEMAEVAAIKAEKPLHNGSHNYESAPFDPSGWDRFAAVRRKAEVLAESIRLEITSGRWPVGARIPKVREIAVAARLSLSTADKAVQMIQADGLLEYRHGYGHFVIAAP
jgi:predicted GIY-YIG superfamily endonuclease